MPSGGMLIFDLDGVLVDVFDSYRETLIETVKHFTGSYISNEAIQEWKNQGGFNDDWVLAHRIIQDAGVDVAFDEVVAHFQSIFLGPNGDGTEGGLINLERWIPEPFLLFRLKYSFGLSVFTGRFQSEARLTLDRYAPKSFDNVIGLDNVSRPKPDPEGLLKIIRGVPYRSVHYLGDTVDDAQSAYAARVPFIGIAGPRTPRRKETIKLLREHGAVAVLESVNMLEQLLERL